MTKKYYVRQDGKTWEFTRREFLTLLTLGATGKLLDLRIGQLVQAPASDEVIEPATWHKEDFEQALREQRGCPLD